MSLFPTGTPMAAEVTRAARSVRRDSDPWVVAYHPVARLNPYQSLLYSRAWESGFAPVATARLADLTAIRCAPPMGVRAAVHLHWTSGVTNESASLDDAHTRASGFLTQLEQLREDGTRLIWTVHNRMPHDCPYPEAEIRLRRELSTLVDVVHIMEKSAPAEVRDLYPLPEDRLLLAPHPSYLGAYPAHHSRDLVRFDLGLDRDDFVVGMIGSIQPYKGLDELIDAVAGPEPPDPRLRTVVAGVPGEDVLSQKLVQRLREVGTIKSMPRKLTEQNVSQLVSALDVMVLPYRASLNSGVALLAFSFGIPVIAPRIGPFRAFADRGYCLAYDPEDPAGLTGALREAPDWVGRVDLEAMRDDMAALSGPHVSERFFADLRGMLEDERSRPVTVQAGAYAD